MVIAKRQGEVADDRAVATGWMTASLSRQKKLPKLAKLLSSSRRRRPPQTVAEQRAALSMLATIYGGTLQKAKST